MEKSHRKRMNVQHIRISVYFLKKKPHCNCHERLKVFTLFTLCVLRNQSNYWLRTTDSNSSLSLSSSLCVMEIDLNRSRNGFLDEEKLGKYARRLMIVSYLILIYFVIYF